jgi:uncharacterized protein (TIGR02677 family)
MTVTPREPVAGTAVQRALDSVSSSPTPGSDSEPGDARLALSYLIYGEVDEYIAIMDVLESSVTELTPAEVARAVGDAGRFLAQEVVEDRLDRLRAWGAVHATTDTSRILRYSDMLARNWRYTATAVGRHVHRFYRTALAGTPAVREIPLASLNRIVRTLEQLRDGRADNVADAVSEVFVSHDDLDGALVGAEDALAGLADRYDLDTDSAAELRGLLVDYATRVAAELEDGSAQASHLLRVLRHRFETLAAAAVEASEARSLIERGALTASKGGRVSDWDGLAAWFDPTSGRAARFSMRLVRALPGMHTNLRRLHTSAGAATGRSRALRLAAACGHAELGTAIAAAALGDHPWRKLHGEADDHDLTRTPSWAAGPQAPVPETIALTGRGGARGRAPAARDDSTAKAVVQLLRDRRAALRKAAVAEVLAAQPGSRLSETAAAIALEVLLAAARRAPVRGTRSATCDGLACTLFRTGDLEARPAAAGPRWTIWTPGRMAVFHSHGTAVACDGVIEDTDARAAVTLGSVA